MRCITNCRLLRPAARPTTAVVALAWVLTWTTLLSPLYAAEAPPPSVAEIRIVEAGGASGESIDKGYIEPFTRKTGIRVVHESPSGLGKLRAMVQSGNVSATLVEIADAAVEQAKALNLLEPLDWTLIDPLPVFPEAKDPYALGYQYFSTVMVWRKDAKPLSGWKDFWNARDFPGKRSLPDIPYYALPIALLADGVAPNEMYPIDIDRAFRSLDRIKDEVVVWWKAGAQPVQLLDDNEIQYAAAWSGRVVSDAGVGYSFNEGLLTIGFFAVPRGIDAARKRAAMQLLHEMTVPENQAVAAGVIPYTGDSPNLEALLPADRLGEFPTTEQNRCKQVLADGKWWFDHAEEVERRWQEFKLGL